MKKEYKGITKYRRYRILILIMCFISLQVLSMKTVLAGGVNGNEASVVAVARGTFTYEGKKYHASESSISTLINYLSRDDINLTAEQASKAIGMIYANVKSGVEGGYLVLEESEAANNTGSKSDDNKEESNQEKSNDDKANEKEDTDLEKDNQQDNDTKKDQNAEIDLEESNNQEMVDQNSGKVNIDVENSKIEVKDKDKALIYSDKLPIKNTGFDLKDTIIVLTAFFFVFFIIVFFSLRYQYRDRNRGL